MVVEASVPASSYTICVYSVYSLHISYTYVIALLHYLHTSLSCCAQNGVMHCLLHQIFNVLFQKLNVKKKNTVSVCMQNKHYLLYIVHKPLYG